MAAFSLIRRLMIASLWTCTFCVTMAMTHDSVNVRMLAPVFFPNGTIASLDCGVHGNYQPSKGCVCDTGWFTPADTDPLNGVFCMAPGVDLSTTPQQQDANITNNGTTSTQGDTSLTNAAFFLTGGVATFIYIAVGVGVPLCCCWYFRRRIWQYFKSKKNSKSRKHKSNKRSKTRRRSSSRKRSERSSERSEKRRGSQSRRRSHHDDAVEPSRARDEPDPEAIARALDILSRSQSAPQYMPAYPPYQPPPVEYMHYAQAQGHIYPQYMSPAPQMQLQYPQDIHVDMPRYPYPPSPYIPPNRGSAYYRETVELPVPPRKPRIVIHEYEDRY